MNIKMRNPSLLLTVALTFGGLAVQGHAVAAGKTTLSSADRSLAMWEVQNVMSRHAFYHAVGDNTKEVDDLWVDRRGPNAKTATFGSPGWVMNGIETVRAAYGEEHARNRQKALTALAAVDPSVKDVPENLGAGDEWAMHTNTTPVLEIAGDGKTAKGVWYSPGMGLFSRIEDGKAVVKGTFFWEKYAADFIKENGAWKIWHLQMAYDFTPSLDDKWLNTDTKAEVQAGEKIQELPPGFSKPKYSYPKYSPSRVPTIYPPLPVPYYTLKDTFSY
jgi:hypothetical protein